MTETDFFDRTETKLRAGLRRGAHLPWYSRLWRGRSSRSLVVVFAALAVATPAVGAVTHWYGLGAPNNPRPELQAWGFGNAIRGGSRLLLLRVPDPQGGPPWGIRLVRVQGGTCKQIGRVENGQIGSLGIDDYWHNDQLFHPYPAKWGGQSCGTNGDGGGGGMFDASANAPTFHNGVQADGCAINPRAASSRPACPSGSLRIVLFITLGTRAKSITYRTQTGTLQTQKSPDRQGTFLLVFPLDATTCRRYLQGQLESKGTCRPHVRRGLSTASNPFSAAIKTINLRNGKSVSFGH